MNKKTTTIVIILAIVGVLFIGGNAGLAFWKSIEIVNEMESINEEIKASATGPEKTHSVLYDEERYINEQTMLVVQVIDRVKSELRMCMLDDQKVPASEEALEEDELDHFIMGGSAGRLKAALMEYNQVLEEEYSAVMKKYPGLKMDVADVTENRQKVSWEERTFKGLSIAAVMTLLTQLKECLKKNSRIIENAAL